MDSDSSIAQAGEQEFRALTPEELKACQDGCKPGGCKVADLEKQLLQQLYKKGLIHLDVPIRPNDHVSIPPLEVRLNYNQFCAQPRFDYGSSSPSLHADAVRCGSSSRRLATCGC